MRFVLASASPARLGVLRAAGLDPEVRVSDVDEAAVLASVPDLTAAERVAALARAKVAAVLPAVAGPAVLLGCDSMLLLDGVLLGKPGRAELARERWSQLAGRTGQLLTGHALVRIDASGAVLSQRTHTRSTGVTFATPTAAQLDAYVASGEPLQVAGGFTLDGLGGWFVDHIDGDPSNVIGVSLPLLRTLLTEVGVEVTRLWRR